MTIIITDRDTKRTRIVSAPSDCRDGFDRAMYFLMQDRDEPIRLGPTVGIPATTDRDTADSTGG